MVTYTVVVTVDGFWDKEDAQLFQDVVVGTIAKGKPDDITITSKIVIEEG